MQVLVIGASGLIGSAVIARLRQGRIAVRGLARSRGARLAQDDWVKGDLRFMLTADDWVRPLEGVTAVVNCAGVLQEGADDSPDLVHRAAAKALYTACERARVRQVIHFSAMCGGEPGLTDFMQSKHEAENDLRSRSLDWVIIRPAVVVGRSAYGGSALMRGLASLPIVPRLANAGRIQITQLDDLVETVLRLVTDSTPSRVVLEVAHPQTFAFEDVVARYRQWFGWRPAIAISLPEWVMSLAYWAGDIAGHLGWRPAVRSTARKEMTRGAVGNPEAWMKAMGIAPRSLDDALLAQPASVQERWFAKLYLLKPVVFVLFAAFWIATALVSLRPGYQIGVGLMLLAGAGPLSGPAVVAGALADLVIGLAILFRKTAKLALFAALGLSLFYLVAGTLLLPHLWAEPLGPMLKIGPIMALNLVALAILEDR